MTAHGTTTGRMAAAGLAALVFGLGGLIGPAARHPASVALADTTAPGYTTRASTPTQTDVAPNGPLTGLQNGTPVTITVTGSPIFGIEVRQCKAGLDIQFNSDFVPSGGNCIIRPFNADSAFFAEDSAAPDNISSTLTFRVGAGTQTLLPSDVDSGESTTITCDAANPCQLWIKEQVPSTINSGQLWIHYDLQFGSGPGVTLPTTTTTTSSGTGATTTLPATTTTAAVATTTTTSARPRPRRQGRPQRSPRGC